MKDFAINENESKASWLYEYNMWRRPAIFLTIWKVLMLSALMPAIVVFASTAAEGFIKALLTFSKVFGLVAVIISILLFIAYFIVCLVNGGKYIVIFEMDSLGIKHIQMEKQFTKAQGISYIGATIGTLKKDLVTISSNLTASSKKSTYSEFKKIRKVESIKKRNIIKIRTSNGFNNQIYIDNKHYDVVLKMIINKCPKNAIIKINEK